MAPLSTYCTLILQSIICLCEKPNFTIKKLFSDYYCISNDKKNSKPKKKTSKIMTDDIVQTNQCLEHGFKSYLRIALVND